MNNHNFYNSPEVQAYIHGRASFFSPSCNFNKWPTAKERHQEKTLVLLNRHSKELSSNGLIQPIHFLLLRHLPVSDTANLLLTFCFLTETQCASIDQFKIIRRSSSLNNKALISKDRQFQYLPIALKNDLEAVDDDYPYDQEKNREEPLQQVLTMN